jgi:hypothetical protein
MFKLCAIAIILSLLYSSLVLSAHPLSSQPPADSDLEEGEIVEVEANDTWVDGCPPPGSIGFAKVPSFVHRAYPSRTQVSIWSTSTLVQALD